MTLLNILSVVVFAAIVAISVRVYLRFRQEIKDAQGLGSVNERGEIGTSEEGDMVREL